MFPKSFGYQSPSYKTIFQFWPRRARLRRSLLLHSRRRDAFHFQRKLSRIRIYWQLIAGQCYYWRPNLRFNLIQAYVLTFFSVEVSNMKASFDNQILVPFHMILPCPPLSTEATQVWGKKAKIGIQSAILLGTNQVNGTTRTFIVYYSSTDIDMLQRLKSKCYD